MYGAHPTLSIHTPGIPLPAFTKAATLLGNVFPNRNKQSINIFLGAQNTQDADSSGEVLLSMSYLPAANRLILVLIKARNIHSDQRNDLVGKDLYVKVTLRHQKHRLKKKQSKRAKHKINPVWNEMIMFEVPPELLGEVNMEMEMLYQESPGSPSHVLGSCYLGPERTGSGKSHWQEMMNNPRRQIAVWHHLLP